MATFGCIHLGLVICFYYRIVEIAANDDDRRKTLSHVGKAEVVSSILTGSTTHLLVE